MRDRELSDMAINDAAEELAPHLHMTAGEVVGILCIIRTMDENGAGLDDIQAALCRSPRTQGDTRCVRFGDFDERTR